MIKQYPSEKPLGKWKDQYLQTNENGNAIFKNLWDAAKAVL